MKPKKSLRYYLRSLHRDLGYLTIGFVILYSLSGIILIYRDTDFMRHTVVKEKNLKPNLSASELASTIRLRNLKVMSEDSLSINFAEGTYHKTTGLANYTTDEVIFPFNKFIGLHKATNQSLVHWVTALFGVILLFLAVSSLWMFKPQTRHFKRGIWLVVTGTAISVLLLFMV